MEFVSNANYKGELNEVIDLAEMHMKIPNSVLHIKPRQLVVKDAEGTLILFASGKFRTMGCINFLEASSLAYKYLEKAVAIPFLSFPFITLQSYSLRSQLGFHVNLSKMADNVSCVYEPELFPALRLNEYKPISVNVFTTGRVIVFGLKHLHGVDDMMNHLRIQCEPYKLHS